MSYSSRLASIAVFLRSTDHLSDRELALLPDSFVRCDVIGGGSEEDNAILLRYYATEDERTLEA